MLISIKNSAFLAPQHHSKAARVLAKAPPTHHTPAACLCRARRARARPTPPPQVRRVPYPERSFRSHEKRLAPLLFVACSQSKYDHTK